MRNLLSRLLLSVGLLFGFAGVASADLIFDIDTGNAAISGYPGPYAQVTVHWVDSTHATITFDALSSGAITYYMGTNGAAAVNVSGAFSLGTMSCTPGFGPTCGPLSSGGAANEDGFAKFNLTIDSFDGLMHSSSQIVFDITATGGNSWADENSVLTPNKNGGLAAAHIFVVDPACGTIGATGACATGYAAGSNSPTPPVVPEPEGLALVGIGLMLLVASRRRKIG